MSVAFLLSALVQFALGLVIAWMIGPVAFGVHALGLAASVLVQTLLFDWLRLAVTRYASAGDAIFHSALRRAFGLLAALCLPLALAGFFLGGMMRWIYALVPLIALATGLAEFIAAHQRALFDQRAYARLSAARALFAVIMCPLAAWWFGTPEATMLAYGLSVLLATLAALLRRREGASEGGPSDGQAAITLGDAARYAGPVVVTNLAYLGLFFALRAYVALDFGLSAAGQFSLALELGLKIVMTLGTAMDVYLFQLAVREMRSHPLEHVQKRLKWNAELVTLVLALNVVGLALVLSSIEILIIAPAFREGFRLFMLGLLPGLLIYGVVQYALHPFGQLREDTLRLAIAALTGALAGLLALLVGRIWLFAGAHVIVGVVLGVAMGIAAIVLIARNGSPFRSAIRFASGLSLVLVGLAWASYPGRIMEPGVLALLVTIIAGGVGALAACWIFDVARARAIINARYLPPLE